jgi:phospholipid N-methyltransferase
MQAPTASRQRFSIPAILEEGEAWVAMLKQFVANPSVIGAIAPSSRELARRMVRGIDLKNAKAVLEYGPGTGSFTPAILRKLPPECRYVAIELDPGMVKVWRKRHPDLPLRQTSVANVEAVCRKEGISRVDAIFSGLPWASFPDSLQRRALEGTVAVLRPGGRFVTFGYWIGTMLPQGKKFYDRLPDYFSKVTYSRYVPENLPPAFVVRCTK